jgi:protein gp37
MFRDQERYGQNPNIVRRTSPSTFTAPLHWNEPQRIFTCSWSDFFIEEADPWRDDAWGIIAMTPQHTYQILTKRPERIPDEDYAPNVWLGVSVENARFYQRVERLQKLQAAVRFLSIEPLLGPMADLPLDGIGWVIVGGESGPDFRPLNLEWVRQIRDRCTERGIPFFFKQHSALQPKKLGRLLDGREWNEFPVAALDAEAAQKGKERR